MSGKCTLRKCRICHDAGRIEASRRAIQSGNIPRAFAFLHYWSDRCFHAEADLNYCEAILDGSWPQSVEILERALINAKKRRENER